MKRTASETRERNYGEMSRGTHLNAADRNPGSHPAFAASAAKWRGVHFAEKKGQSFSTTVAAAFVQSATRFPTSVPLHLAHLSLARVEKKETGWTERGNFRRWKILGEMYQPCAFPQWTPLELESLFMRDVLDLRRPRAPKWTDVLFSFFFIMWRKRSPKQHYVVINSIHIALIRSISRGK